MTSIYGSTRVSCAALIGAACLAMAVPLGAFAQTKAADSPYAHALSDLRQAKAGLQHRRDEPPATSQEASALQEVNKAIGEVTQIVMGRGLRGDGDRPIGEGATGTGPGANPTETLGQLNAKPDVHADQGSRLRNVEDALRKAKSDVDMGKSDPATKAEHDRIVGHIDMALQSVQAAQR